jgi:hypothetical protein
MDETTVSLTWPAIVTLALTSGVVTTILTIGVEPQPQSGRLPAAAVQSDVPESVEGFLSTLSAWA